MNNKIENIIKNFKWRKVRKAMKALNWTWHDSETLSKIPSIGELVIQSIKLLEEVEKKSLIAKCNIVVGTGGFKAKAYYDKETKEIDFELSFIVESWESYE